MLKTHAARNREVLILCSNSMHPQRPRLSVLQEDRSAMQVWQITKFSAMQGTAQWRWTRK